MPPPPPAPPVFYAFKDNETLVGEFFSSAVDTPPPQATPGMRTRHAKTPQPRQALISAFLLTSRLPRQLRHQGAARRRRQARQVHDRSLRWFARRQPPRTRRPGERAMGQVVSASYFQRCGPLRTMPRLRKSLPAASQSASHDRPERAAAPAFAFGSRAAS